MKVLVLPSWYFEKGSSQLSGRMFHHLAKALRARDIDARIFYGQLHALGPLKKQIHYSVEDNVPSWRMEGWFPPKMNASLVSAWVNKYVHSIEDIMHHEWKPDIIHAHSYFTGAVAAALSKKHNIPYVYTERMSQFVSGNIPPRYRAIIQSSFDTATVVTTVSKGLQKRLQKFTSKEIRVVPNFFDSAIFFYKAALQKDSIFQWVTVGEPAGIKGLDILLKAFGELRRIRPAYPMRMILIDEVKDKKELIRIIDDYKMNADIVWKGVISQEEIATIMRMSHAFISASRIETFGKAIIEAQACGLPVIATKTDGASDIFNDEMESLVEINDVPGLVKAMEHLVTNQEDIRRDTIAEKAYKRFSEPVVIDQWIEIYNSFLK